ncbi:MAG: Mth938-like domain-containing protein [Francisellaceae bacterium]
MNLELEKPDTEIYVKHFRDGEIILPNETLKTGVIITPDKIIMKCWPVSAMDQLTLETIDRLLDEPYDVILLGTGSKLQIPNAKIINAFARLGKALDFMDSAAACRTFNLLAAEGRKVIAAIIV